LVIAADRGAVVPVATSDGDLLGAPVTTERDRRKLKRLQKKLARTQRGSKRRLKALNRLRAKTAKLTRRRRDMTHQITSTLAKNHRVVILEDLKVQAMTASARGTIAEPGRNVAQKAGLNRAILDVGWGEIERQLSYKLAWRGGVLMKVPAANTSRTCARCLTVDAASRVSRDRFKCTSCGHEADADVNAAIEIRRRGLIALGLRPRPGLPGLPVEPSAPSKAPCKTREKKKSGTQPRGANAPETARA
jgi:putative transposase